ncbi:MAG: helix-turn-helix transcriptional regulator [bacterium]
MDGTPKIRAFGRLLNYRRNTLGLTAKEVAERIGLKKNNSVLSWENGECFPCDILLSKISVVYEIPLSDLVEVLVMSKGAKEEEKRYHLNARRNGKPVRRNPEEFFNGRIENLVDITRLNF